MAKEQQNQGWLISADRPLKPGEDDAFGRAPFATALANQLCRLRKGESYVVGLQGPWGAGKTSILNMVTASLRRHDEIALLQFNPWLFSGTDQLALHFFQEVSSQLQRQNDKKLQDAGTAMVKYGESLSPLASLPWVGTWAQRLAGALKVGGKLTSRFGGALQESISAQKRQIEELLAASPKRLLVVVDDIDRLSKQEIRDLFKLVRLTADFPNVTYLLSFDRVRVEEALSDRKGEGREYLEKILQLAFDLPKVRQPDLARFFFAELGKALEGLEHGHFDEAEWANIFHLVIGPLLRTPRDARRLVNAVPTAVALAGAEVALVDLLAIESIRVLLPDVFAEISRCAELLTSTENLSHRDDVDSSRDRFEGLLASAGDRQREVREFCRRIFPASRKWLDNHHYGSNWLSSWRKDGRLAHPDVLSFYLEKGLPASVLGERQVRKLFAQLGDAEALNSQVKALDAEALEHALGRLEAYEEDFPPEVAHAAVPVFLNEGDRLREEKRGMFDLGSSFAVSRIVLRLLRAVPEEDRGPCVVSIMAKVGSLSKKRMLVDLVGHAEGSGHKLISEEAAAQLNDQLRQEILAASADELRGERELCRLLLWADDGSTVVPTFLTDKLNDAPFVLQLLRSGVSETHSMALGDVASHRETTLPWDYLAELVGEKRLKEAVRAIAAAKTTLSRDERDRIAIEAAEKYASGWRPDRDGHYSASKNLEDRKYAEYILINLLDSGVPARRKTAYERLREMRNQSRRPPRTVVEKLAKISTDTEMTAAERYTAIDLLEGTAALKKAESTLLQQVFTEPSMDDSLASKIASLFRDRPATLLDKLEAVSVPPPEEKGSRYRTVLQAVATCLTNDPALLDDEVMRRAVDVSQRFKDLKPCSPAVERIQQAFEGEAR